MLDTAGNRYAASQSYQAKADTKPQAGDVVIYPVADEERYFSDKWHLIDGVEVHVTRVLFRDATVWTPRKGADCKTAFINDDYDKEMKRRGKAAEQKMKAWREKWNREHPDNPLPEDTEKPK